MARNQSDMVLPQMAASKYALLSSLDFVPVWNPWVFALMWSSIMVRRLVSPEYLGTWCKQNKCKSLEWKHQRMV